MLSSRSLNLHVTGIQTVPSNSQSYSCGLGVYGVPEAQTTEVEEREKETEKDRAIC